MYVCMYVYIYIYICIYVCMYVYIYICMQGDTSTESYQDLFVGHFHELHRAEKVHDVPEVLVYQCEDSLGRLRRPFQDVMHADAVLVAD